MNRREAIKTIGSLAGIAATSRLLPGCGSTAPPPDPPISCPTCVSPPVDAALAIISSDPSWGTSWTHVVPGRWSDAPYDGLLLYSQTTGTAAFYDTDGTGRRVMPARQIDTWWRHSWAILEAGYFHDSPFSCVVAYDQTAGYLAIFGTDGAGNVSLPLAERHTRTTWTHIVPGWFVDGTHSSILLYSQTEGHAEVWTIDGGRFTTARRYTDWTTSWTKIVAGPFNAHPQSTHALTDLFFYEGSTGHAEHWSTDGAGSFSFVRGFDGLPLNVAEVFAGNFGSGLGVADLAFLGGDGIPAGHVVFRRLPAGADETDLVVFDDPADTYLRATANVVVAGNFYMADVDDRWFRDGPLVSRPTTQQKLAIQNWRGSVGGFKSFVAYDARAGIAECLMVQPKADTSAPLEGYAVSTTLSAGAKVSTGSVVPGETVAFCVSSAVGAYAIDIHGITPTGTTKLASVTDLPASPSPLYRSRLAYRDGAAWTSVGSFTVPTTWSSGVYVARVTATSGASIEIPFVVRSAAPGPNKILVVIPDATYEAYNIWGGRSLYGFLATGGAYGWAAPGAAPPGRYGPYAFRVAFDRPYHPTDPDPATSLTYRKWLTLEASLVQWLQVQQLGADYCTCRDLDRTVPSTAYKAVVLAGHHEYWSAGMRDNLAAYNSAGGNTVFLSGNTCWFQVRFDYVRNQMTCYKVAEFDPWFSSSSARFTTTNWHLPPVNDPSTRTTGLMWSDHLTGPAGAPGVPLYEFSIVSGQETHWAFEGTKPLVHPSQQGTPSSFGAYFDTYANTTDSIANGAELDCAGGTCFIHGHAAPTIVTSLAEVLLACGDGTAGVGTMCVFRPTPTSWAFNAGTFKWCRGLSVPDATGTAGWTAMDQITRNVFDRFLAETG